MTTMTSAIPTNTATIELQSIVCDVADYILVVKVYDELGFSNERHIWHGTDKAEGERAGEAVRKAFGAVEGLRVQVL